MPATEIDAQPTTASNVPTRRTWLWYLFTFIVCAHFGLSYVGRNRYFLDPHRYPMANWACLSNIGHWSPGSSGSWFRSTSSPPLRPTRPGTTLTHTVLRTCW